MFQLNSAELTALLNGEDAFLRYLNEVEEVLNNKYKLSFKLNKNDIDIMHNYIQAKREPKDYALWYKVKYS